MEDKLNISNNKQGITKIIFKCSSKNFQTLGYVNNFTITIKPDNNLINCSDIENFINEEIFHRVYSIEDSVQKLYEFIDTAIRPKYLKVESQVTDLVKGEVIMEIESKGRTLNG